MNTSYSHLPLYLVVVIMACFKQGCCSLISLQNDIISEQASSTVFSCAFKGHFTSTRHTAFLDESITTPSGDAPKKKTNTRAYQLHVITQRLTILVEGIWLVISTPFSVRHNYWKSIHLSELRILYTTYGCT